uniref:Arrestin domain-containing protein 3-like n=1 Tax=Phallusia mammillata TaxID=59560 RepID=A0A6F9D7L2_9ASCI|nr:arrestin domain-containing protein 3-like [Phallusia mammillata]
MVNLSIEITGGKTVFKANQTISGNVVVECSQPIDFKSIEITFKGTAKVQWTEHHGKNSTTYTGKQSYFENTVTLLTSTGQKIPSGRNTYPYQFTLPPNLPSSFEVQHGYIRYRMQAKLDEGLTSKKNQLFFTVLEHVDLNKISSAKHPSSMETSKTLCCLCCASGLIEGRVTTDKTGIVPGEYITANGSVDNMSNSNLRKCSMRIVQVTQLHADACGAGKTKTIVNVLTDSGNMGKPCAKRSSVTLDTQKLQLPAVVPSHQQFCRVIDVEYYVELDCKTPRCHFNLKVRAPLEVGTIPLDHGAQGTETSLDQPSYGAPSGMAPAQYSIPPPSYASAATVTIPKSDDNPQEQTYAPQYNYYDWSQPAFTYK